MKRSNFPYEAPRPRVTTAEHKDFQNMSYKPIREGMPMAAHIERTKGNTHVQEAIANTETGQGAVVIGE